MGPTSDSVFISYNRKTGSYIAKELAETLKEAGLDPWWLQDPVHSSQLKVTVDNALRNCYRTILVWTTPELSAWQRLEVHFMQGLLQDRLHSSDMFIIVRAKNLLKGGSHSHLEFLEAAEYIDWPSGQSAVLSHLSESRIGPLYLNLPTHLKPKLDSAFRSDKLRPHGMGQYSFSGHFCNLKGNETTYIAPDAWSGFHWLLLEDPWNYFIQHPRPTITHRRRWHVGNVRIGRHMNKVHLAVVKNAEAHEWAKRRVMHGDFSGIPREQFEQRFSIVDTLNVSGT